MITADVGVTRLIQPDADWYAVTATARSVSAKSATGPRIGMTSAAWPDDDGTRKAIGRLTIQASAANVRPDRSSTAASIHLRIVSVMNAFFITTVMPRASTITRAAPRNSPAPDTSVDAVRC